MENDMEREIACWGFRGLEMVRRTKDRISSSGFGIWVTGFSSAYVARESTNLTQ